MRSWFYIIFKLTTRAQAHYKPIAKRVRKFTTSQVYIVVLYGGLYNGWPCICGYIKSIYHGNGNILTLWSWLNDAKRFYLCQFNYNNNHVYSVKIINHFKLSYTNPCNYLTKRASVNQPSMFANAKDSKISNYLNLSMYLPTIIIAIIKYTPNMIIPTKWTQICSLLLVNLLLLISKFSFIC